MTTLPVLRVACPDQAGLVHTITKTLTDFGANIVRNDEFVDRAAGHFFMRTAFENVVSEKWFELEKTLRSRLSNNAVITLETPRPKNIVLCVTKEYHCLGDLLLRHQFGDLNANILGVISNHNDLRDLVERFDLPFHYIPHENISREEHEAELLECLGQFDLDYIVLAKYMRILSDKVVAPYAGRMINIHHSFLPAFIGAKPYLQAYTRGVKMIGATAHFVTNDLDEGPIIVQQVVNVDHNYDAVAMAQSGREVETQTLAKALKLVLDDRVFISGNKTVVF